MGEVPDQIEADGVDVVQVAENDEHWSVAAEVRQQPDDLGEQNAVVVSRIGGQWRKLRARPERRDEASQSPVATRELLPLLLGTAGRVALERHGERTAGK